MDPFEREASILAQFKGIDSIKASKYTFNRIEHRSFLGNRQNFLIAQNRTQPDDTICLRVKAGPIGHSEWMNELQVYLLPDFGHKNILVHYGSDKLYRRISANQIRCDNYRVEGENDGPDKTKPTVMVEYWLMNRYSHCKTLRELLKENTLTWLQMMNIAKGIMKGLHYLHENTDFQEFDISNATNGFISTTNGSLKRVSIIEHRPVIFLRPGLRLTIIHRNLSSMNVIIKGDLTPCIWSFERSYIYHPFQPLNNPQYIKRATQETYLASQYSPPEVIQATSHFTLSAMKSIDMYAIGIIFWEMLSRTVLPKLDSANEKEEKKRSKPGRYYEPFEKEFGGELNTKMLEYAVCKEHARPRLKDCWLAGTKTYKFVRIILDLWDHDFDARIHTSTVLYRLGKLSLIDHDRRYKYPNRYFKDFVRPDIWPPRYECHQGPNHLVDWSTNIKLEDLTNAKYREDTRKGSVFANPPAHEIVDNDSLINPTFNQSSTSRKIDMFSTPPSPNRSELGSDDDRFMTNSAGHKKSKTELEEQIEMTSANCPIKDGYPEIEVAAEVSRQAPATESLREEETIICETQIISQPTSSPAEPCTIESNSTGTEALKSEDIGES